MGRGRSGDGILPYKQLASGLEGWRWQREKKRLGLPKKIAGESGGLLPAIFATLPKGHHGYWIKPAASSPVFVVFDGP